ncbi:MAG: C_GCAxxG_C_C family protein [Lachnospiraceae bacterium]|nr:C_GCAxxG_C_C family protein [Lachnospiraceae bacterium]
MCESRYVRRAEELRASTDVIYNCCQAVVVPFTQDAGLPEEAVRRLTSNYGGGLKMGATCGAVCGGLMVLGLFGANDPALIGYYYRRLREKHDGMLNCADLLRVNKERGGLKKPHCDAMVRECVALAEEILRESGKLDG